MYLTAASTISHQQTFGKKGFSENLLSLEKQSALQKPNYKDYIDPGMIRRMSEIIKMSVCCSVDCMKQAQVENADAIIVGTGLGCLQDTEKFLQSVITTPPDGLLSPTSFIQSTHNTVAGQLSLIFKNHNYNMTHTQNTLSFEHALQDALLCLNEGNENILLGAADEHIPVLNDIAGQLNFSDVNLTSGASFFILSNKKQNAKVKVDSVSICAQTENVLSDMEKFLAENKKNIDLILYSSLKGAPNIFSGTPDVDYQKYCGTYFSNSAFAFHLASDIIESGKIKIGAMEKQNIKTVLVCNNLNPANLGLTLLTSVEA